MESPLLGLILDSSVIIAAERKRQTVEEFLTSVGQTFGEVEIAISAVTLAELVHGVARANTPEIRRGRRSFIDELKKHVPVHPITDSTAEIAGQISGEEAAKGIKLPADDLLIGASAIEQGYAVATLNTRHFQKIPGLQVLSF
jgi:tRNA(fMet)-specific endonuclease VapC